MHLEIKISDTAIFRNTMSEESKEAELLKLLLSGSDEDVQEVLDSDLFFLNRTLESLLNLSLKYSVSARKIEALLEHGAFYKEALFDSFEYKSGSNVVVKLLSYANNLSQEELKELFLKAAQAGYARVVDTLFKEFIIDSIEKYDFEAIAEELIQKTVKASSLSIRLEVENSYLPKYREKKKKFDTVIERYQTYLEKDNELNSALRTLYDFKEDALYPLNSIKENILKSDYSDFSSLFSDLSQILLDNLESTSLKDLLEYTKLAVFDFYCEKDVDKLVDKLEQHFEESKNWQVNYVSIFETSVILHTLTEIRKEAKEETQKVDQLINEYKAKLFDQLRRLPYNLLKELKRSQAEEVLLVFPVYVLAKDFQIDISTLDIDLEPIYSASEKYAEIFKGLEEEMPEIIRDLIEQIKSKESKDNCAEKLNLEDLSKVFISSLTENKEKLLELFLNILRNQRIEVNLVFGSEPLSLKDLLKREEEKETKESSFEAEKREKMTKCRKFR